MSKERIRVCDSCSYFSRVKGEETGLCHRNPPVLVHIGEQFQSIVPNVPPKWWCGEWRNVEVEDMVTEKENRRIRAILGKE